MAILLGVDTGGTYTDAVLMEDNKNIIASSKALTTKYDLSIGIGEAVQAVLMKSTKKPSEIAMASLSTTLATNALVEGQGEKVGLVAIGFSNQDLQRHGLAKAMKGDPIIIVDGGHTHSGEEKSSLDLSKIGDSIDGWGDEVTAFAVVSSFATRNPAHEILARDLIREKTGKPVTCSSDLSAKLNGPKRAVTSVLNARLIGLIDRLIDACKSKLKALGVSAPLMVVRGDGALISAEMAQEKPIETILSGPAASIVGAQWLTNEVDAVVSDIGGTTTDIAILRKGHPQIDPMGAKVGEFRTMVEAVAMHTTGLGGDSEVHMQSEGLEGSLSLGPSRIVPIALAAISWPDVVLSTLESQVSSKKCGEYDAKFVLPTLIKSKFNKFNDREIILLKKIGTEAKPLDGLLSNRLELATLDRLVSRGVLMMSGITPTDASHVLGISNRWNTEASRLALKVFSNRRKGSGDVLSEGADLLAQSIIDQLTKQTGDALINVALIEDGYENNIDNTSIEDSWLINKGLQHHNNTFFINFGLRLPVIGLGASAKIYYPKVGELLSTQMIIPKHYSVANAIGAVAGRISFTCVGTVTSPSTGCFRLHGKDGPKDFSSERRALKVLTDDLSSLASKKARSSGADEIDLQVSRDIRYSNIENQRIFMEAEIAVTASGRPRITTG